MLALGAAAASKCLETMKSSKAEIGKAAAANKMKGYIARAPAALAAVSGKLLSTELLKKLTMDDIRGLMLTDPLQCTCRPGT